MSSRFARIFAEIVTDLREKLVEEPWYGRPLDRAAPQHASAAEPVSLAALMGWDKLPDTPGDMRQPAAHDMDLDR